MDGVPTTDRRNRLLHVAASTAVFGSLAAGGFELWRALGGNGLSWAYSAEWPLIAGYLTYMWIRLARERRGAPSTGGDGRVAEPTAAADPDPQLRAWQEYLARLHAVDPPGGPSRSRDR